MTVEYTDYLAKHMKRQAEYVLDSYGANLPTEFAGISRDKLIDLIAEHSTPILRKMEGDAIRASMYLVASMIRFSKAQKESK